MITQNLLALAVSLIVALLIADDVDNKRWLRVVFAVSAIVLAFCAVVF